MSIKKRFTRWVGAATGILAAAVIVASAAEREHVTGLEPEQSDSVVMEQSYGLMMEQSDDTEPEQTTNTEPEQADDSEPEQADGADAEQYDDEERFTVKVLDDGKSVEIIRYRMEWWAIVNKVNKNIRIPPQIQGKAVTVIGRGAFRDKQLAGVVIPNTVKIIGESAFGSNQLTDVTIPNGVTEIGAEAFKDNLLTSVDIPNSVRIIGESAFRNNQLTCVEIPNGVSNIGKSAFSNNQLTRVTIPSSVRIIEESAFAYNQLTDVIIPDGVTEIGRYAFHKNRLTCVEIPNSVIAIGESAFFDNDCQRSKIEKALRKNRRDAAKNQRRETLDKKPWRERPQRDDYAGLNTGLGPFDLGLKNVTLLGVNLVDGRNDMQLDLAPLVLADPYFTNIYIMVTPFHYRRRAGESYYSVMNVKPYLNVMNFIDNDAKNPLSFGPFVSVNYTPYYDANRYIASAGILANASILFHAEAGYRVVHGRGGGYYFNAMLDVGSLASAFAAGVCMIPHFGSRPRLHGGPYGSYRDNYAYPAPKYTAETKAVEEAGGGGPYNDETDFVITSASDRNYIEITKYTGKALNVRIPPLIYEKPVTSIGDSAFYGRGLTDVTIPEGVTAIGKGAFAENRLTNITIPDGVTDIEFMVFSNNRLTGITIPNSVTVIGELAFAENSLTDITLPEGVTTIGAGAFFNNRLTGVTISNSVTDIGGWAFAGNDLTDVTIPSGVKTIGREAFCRNLLTGVIIPDSVTRVAEWAFAHNQLTDIAIPESVEWIGRGAFAYNLLTNVAVPGSVKKIGDSAFAHNLLTGVTLSSGVAEIGAGAFKDNRLTGVIIPKSVKRISRDAFDENPRPSQKVMTGNMSARWNDRARRKDYTGFGIGIGPFDFGVTDLFLLGMGFDGGGHGLELNVLQFVLADPYITNIYTMITPFYYRRRAGENYFSAVNVKPYVNVMNFIDNSRDRGFSFGPFADVNYTPYYDANKYTVSAGILARRAWAFHAEAGYRVTDRHRREGSYYFNATFDVWTGGAIADFIFGW